MVLVWKSDVSVEDLDLRYDPQVQHHLNARSQFDGSCRERHWKKFFGFICLIIFFNQTMNVNSFASFLDVFWCLWGLKHWALLSSFARTLTTSTLTCRAYQRIQRSQNFQLWFLRFLRSQMLCHGVSRCVTSLTRCHQWGAKQSETTLECKRIARPLVSVGGHISDPFSVTRLSSSCTSLKPQGGQHIHIHSFTCVHIRSQTEVWSYCVISNLGKSESLQDLWRNMKKTSLTLARVACSCSFRWNSLSTMRSQNKAIAFGAKICQTQCCRPLEILERNGLFHIFLFCVFLYFFLFFIFFLNLFSHPKWDCFFFSFWLKGSASAMALDLGLDLGGKDWNDVAEGNRMSFVFERI